MKPQQNSMKKSNNTSSTSYKSNKIQKPHKTYKEKNETLDMSIVEELLQEEEQQEEEVKPQKVVFQGKRIKFDTAKTDVKKEFPDYLLQVKSIESDPLQKKSQIDPKITEFLQNHFYTRIHRIQSTQKLSQVRKFVAPAIQFSSSK